MKVIRGEGIQQALQKQAKLRDEVKALKAVVKQQVERIAEVIRQREGIGNQLGDRTQERDYALVDNEHLTKERDDACKLLRGPPARVLRRNERERVAKMLDGRAKSWEETWREAHRASSVNAMAEASACRVEIERLAAAVRAMTDGEG